MNPIIVTAAVIFKDDKILISQRLPDKNEGLKWEFAGGKLEEGETPEVCLKREIKEELNLDIAVNDIFKVVYHEYGNITILLLAYHCDLLGGNIKAADCNDYRWVAKNEMKDFVFADADITIVEKLLTS